MTRRLDHTLRAPLVPLLVLLMTPLTGCAGQDAGAVDGDLVVLDEPTAVFPEDFGSVQTVRELSDGRLLVADPLVGALFLVDMDGGTRTVIGSEGQGPGEYIQPDAVWPLPADSTLLVDLGNGRLTVVTPELELASSTPIAGGGTSPATMTVAIPNGVDGQGRVYAQRRGGGFRGEIPDSGIVLRIERGGGADSVTAFKSPEIRRSQSQGMVRIQPVPLSPQDAWGVAPDGSVVVARSGDYHVEWIGPDGSLTSGPPVPYDPIPIGDAEKEAWDDDAGGSGISMQVRMSDNAVSTSFSRTSRSNNQRDLTQFDWPEVLPPVRPETIQVDPLGRAWVARYRQAGEPLLYDLFDRAGEKVGSVELGMNRRVVAFGDGAVFVVRHDEYDLNYLERYGLPGG